jgi:uncharacterized protein YdeI (YjbR/CyaY-like superfamily)
MGMTTSNPNPKVDWFFDKATLWQPELRALRDIALRTGLTEDLKWGHPCYTDQGANIVLIQGFKAYCALLFPKGTALEDPDGILVKVGENTRFARQARFTDLAEIETLAPVLATYIQAAVAVERSGVEIELDEADDAPVPIEFQERLDADPALRAAFSDLTPGRQRAYLLFFNGAKQSKTRESRVEKAIPRILDGLGLND